MPADLCTQITPEIKRVQSQVHQKKRLIKKHVARQGRTETAAQKAVV
jgi:hypothetical protein